jgi:hypothetical protein
MKLIKTIRVVGLALVFTSSFVNAEPNDYIRTPIVEYGEREIDYKFGKQKNRDGSSDFAHSLGYGFTPTAWWFTEFYAKYAKPASERTSFDAWEWENRFQLTEAGQYPIDLGFLLEVERPKNRSEGYQITYGPMFQTEWGRTQGNFNIFIQKNIRATESFDTELHYQVQLKYRAYQYFEWGMQGFGNVGQWNNWKKSTEREFKVGPAIFGKVKVGVHEAISWNAALLKGTSNATPTTTFRLQTEYEF